MSSFIVADRLPSGDSESEDMAGRAKSSSFNRGLVDDGLFMHEIKPHSLEKFERHNRYAYMFATGMKNIWPQRAYVGLYSGPGRARIAGTGEIVETTPMTVLRLPDPFTKCIFVDKDQRCVDALKRRAASIPTNPEVIQGDVNEQVDNIVAALPLFDRSKRLLSFCFVDPFAADLKFNTIQKLGGSRFMDFLVLLMIGRDVRPNFELYYEDRSDTRIEDLINCPHWREEFAASKDKNIVRFIHRKFDEAMVSLGYKPAKQTHHHPVKVPGKNVMQYDLVLYSRHQRGQDFWERTLISSDPQLGLDLDP